jgi:hypothetical protein
MHCEPIICWRVSLSMSTNVTDAFSPDPVLCIGKVREAMSPSLHMSPCQSGGGDDTSLGVVREYRSARGEPRVER